MKAARNGVSAMNVFLILFHLILTCCYVRYTIKGDGEMVARLLISFYEDLG